MKEERRSSYVRRVLWLHPGVRSVLVLVASLARGATRVVAVLTLALLLGLVAFELELARPYWRFVRHGRNAKVMSVYSTALLEEVS
jgi:formate-dependent nitrite reductase membrane component NrfD